MLANYKRQIREARVASEQVLTRILIAWPIRASVKIYVLFCKSFSRNNLVEVSGGVLLQVQMNK